MKKIVAILLSLALVFTALWMTSCGIPDLSDLFDETEEDEGGSTGENESEGDSSEEFDSAEALLGKLLDFGKTTGYEITMKLSENRDETGTVTSGAKGNVWWMMSGESSGTAIVIQSETLLSLYTFDGEAWSFVSNMVGQDVSALLSAYSIGFSAYLFYANDTTALNKLGSETVAGRSCTRYGSGYSYLGSSASYEVAVDNELGVTLRWKYTVTAEGETNTSEMLVTSFQTGSAVSAPELPEAGEDYLDYSGLLGWPANSFTALLPVMPGTVSGSGVQGSTFLATGTDVTEEEFRAYVAALQQKGFAGSTEDGFFFGEDEAGNTVSCGYEEGNISLTLSKAE